MALSDIKKKIEAEAQEEARGILAKADQEVTLINIEAEKDVRGTHSAYNERFNKERPEIIRRREIVANLDVARKQLGAKQKLIGKSFDEALSILVNLNKDKYLSFVHELMCKAMTTGCEVIYVGKDEKHINPEWLDNFNRQSNSSITLADERLHISGGFILRNDRIDTNCSWDMLVRWIRDDIESEVVEKLFGKQPTAPVHAAPAAHSH